MSLRFDSEELKSKQYRWTNSIVNFTKILMDSEKRLHQDKLA